MRASSAAAYAVAVKGVLDVNTVHSHPRGAMVNWLHLHVAGFRAGGALPDEKIREAFVMVQRNYPELRLSLQLVMLNPVRSKDVEIITDLTAPPTQPPPRAH